MTLDVLARLAPRRPTRSALAACMLDGLQAERHVVRLQRSLDVQTGIAREAHQRIDRLVASLSGELREHQETRRQLTEARDLIQNMRVADELATERIRFLEGEQRPLQLRCEGLTEIADRLRDELLTMRRRRKGRR